MFSIQIRARVLFVSGILMLMLSTPAHADAIKRVLLQSYIGDPPESGPALTVQLITQLEDNSILHGDALAREVDSEVSRDPDNAMGADLIRASAENGRKQFIEGEYTEAVKLLSDARAAMLRKQALMASDQTLRQVLHRATLFLAHAYLRLQQNAKAAELVSEVVRSFPDRELSLVQHGPEIVDLYRRVRAALLREKTGTLKVVTSPPGCMVFVNERYVGLAPTKVEDLTPGRYRVYVQRPGQLGRVRHIDVTDADHTMNIDFALDAAVQTKPYVGLRYADKEEQQQYEREHAVKVGRSLGATEVIVVGLQPYQGRKSLIGTVLSAATGGVVRSGLLAIEPMTPAAAELKALGRFLVLGEQAAGVVVRNLDGTEVQTDAPSKTRSVWPWVALGVGVVGIAVGIPLIVTDGSTSCGMQNCPDSVSTSIPGVILTAAGGVALAASAVLFLLRRSTDSEKAQQSAWVTPWVTHEAGGVSTSFTF